MVDIHWSRLAPDDDRPVFAEVDLGKVPLNTDDKFLACLKVIRTKLDLTALEVCDTA